MKEQITERQMAEAYIVAIEQQAAQAQSQADQLRAHAAECRQVLSRTEEA